MLYVTDMATMYRSRLLELGGVVPERVHSSRFQPKVLKLCPWLTYMKEKCDIIREDLFAKSQSFSGEF